MNDTKPFLSSGKKQANLAAITNTTAQRHPGGTILVSSSFKNFILSTDLLTRRSNSPDEITVEVIVLKKIRWMNMPESLIIKTVTYIWWAGLHRAFFLWRKENLHTKKIYSCVIQPLFGISPSPALLHSTAVGVCARAWQFGWRMGPHH